MLVKLFIRGLWVSLSKYLLHLRKITKSRIDIACKLFIVLWFHSCNITLPSRRYEGFELMRVRETNFGLGQVIVIWQPEVRCLPFNWESLLLIPLKVWNQSMWCHFSQLFTAGSRSQRFHRVPTEFRCGCLHDTNRGGDCFRTDMMALTVLLQLLVQDF